MNDVVQAHTALMSRIVLDYGKAIRSAVVAVAGGDETGVEELISEIHFAVFSALRKQAKSWAPSKMFVQAIVDNSVREFLWLKTSSRAAVDERRQLLAAHSRQRNEALARISELTPSEMKTLRLIGLGLTNREIADTLYISELTVRTHVKRCHAKLEVKGRARLALLAYQVCYSESDGH